MKDFKRLRTGEYKLDQVQENLSQFFKQFKDVPLLDGILIKDQRINTTLSLDHKLNRQALGYIITKKSANATVWNGDIDNKTIELTSSGDVTIDIWVF